MPNRDGTGPIKVEPITGRGAGICARYAMLELTNRKIGFGCGGGRGFRRMYLLTGLPRWARGSYAQMPGRQVVDGKKVLKNQEDYLEKQLKQVRDQLKNFDEKV